MNPADDSPKPVPELAAEALARVTAAAAGVAEALRAVAEAQAAEITTACRNFAGAVLATAPASELSRRWAELRRMGEAATRAGVSIPWPALNAVLEAGVGEENAELIKQGAARLFAPHPYRSPGEPPAATREARPVASIKRGQPSYSQRLVKRAAGK